MTQCIWCLRSGGPSSVEHIIPEALGCPPGFVLRDGAVCRGCNNGLAYLDRAVANDFDLFAFINGIPRKGGRPPEIRSRGNIVATKGMGGSEISINMEKKRSTRAHDGSKLGKFGASARNVDAYLDVSDQIGEISFTVEMGKDPRFVRGIVKIGFSVLSFYLGNSVAVSREFDAIRDFVRKAKGTRPILLKVCSMEGYQNQAWPPFRSQNGEYAVAFRIASIEFCVDLSPKAAAFPLFRDKAREIYGETGWSYLPL